MTASHSGRRHSAGPIFDLAVLHCGELLTLAAPDGSKRGGQLAEIGLIRNGAVGIRGGRIAWVGTQKEYRKAHRARREVDAEGRVVMPGFVDPHTHAVFAGSREEEWFQKLKGASYLEILKNGGGILSTVAATRAAPSKALLEMAWKTLGRMLLHGTTTVEIKSGYGLDLRNERKILNVIRRLDLLSPLEVVPTFLGAHVVPEEDREDPSRYVDRVIEMLPEVKPLARFCDVFCEEGAFSAAQAGRILNRAATQGFGIKLHAGQFTDQGGVRVAADFNAASVDHLDVVAPSEMRLMAERGIVGVLLPGVSHFLKAKRSPPARALIEAGVPVALATDFNPGSAPSLSMQEMVHLAVRDFGLTAAEAISAATLNAAHALRLGDRIGSLEVGKQADLILLDLERHEQLPYFFGANRVSGVIKKGKLIRNPPG